MCVIIHITVNKEANYVMNIEQAQSSHYVCTIIWSFADKLIQTLQQT